MSDGAGHNAGSTSPERLARVVPALERAPAGSAADAPLRAFPLQLALRSATGVALPDRGRFRQHLEQRLQRATGTPLALLHLEIATDAPAAGDDALDAILAARLSHALRADDVVGRVGTAQFGCLLAGVPSRFALDRVARRLRAALEAPLQVGPRSRHVHAHIGIALCPRDGATAGVLLKHADEATFRARAYGSGHAFFDPRLDP